jgi:plastocyanin
MKAVLGVLGVIAVVGVAGYVWHTHTTVPAYVAAQEAPGHGVVGSASSTDSYDFLVTFSDDGVSPAEVQIAKGQRVRFLNSSSAAVWPASGVHPTHTLYPEKESTDCLGSSFDACKGLLTGEYFDFTFNYVGTWPYHDHLHAYNTGRITVTP